ncbi:16S rRNA (cytidine(1402)-2'-O)-methyltransferase, partial [Candidatus Gottesmanbacteria bacterium RBG_13_37_7]
MGTLYLISTPIGNLDDITLRAIKTLFSVDYIACEDTRRTGNLIMNYESRIKNKELQIKDLNNSKKLQFISYYDEIEEKKLPDIINLLEKDNNVALVSDSGTPLISDPGYKLVSECIKRKIKVVSIPGPSSVLTALISSGLPPNQFIFLGYLPLNKNKRLKLIEELNQTLKISKNIKPTVIFFESPHRLIRTLQDIKNIFGDITIVVAREMTKIHEEIWRGLIVEFLLRKEK